MNISVVTGSRAEYGLLKKLIKFFNDDETINLNLIVTGTHLTYEYGYTVNEILEDGFSINKRVEIILSSDTASAVSKSIALGVLSFSDVFQEISTDLLVILGDRFEIFSAAVASSVHGLHIAHIHGGETTEGAIDEMFRHSITKMSNFHFCSTETYRKRIIQLGENPKNVFNVGAPGIDHIVESNYLSRKDTLNFLGLEDDDKYFLITFHPVTLEKDKSELYIDNLIKTLSEFTNYKLIFTSPNSDIAGKIILNKIKLETENFPNRSNLFLSLGQNKYLNALKHSELIIGNSSSGIIEAPSLNVPTINIGTRQKGRVKGYSVIDCDYSRKSISDAIKKGISRKFKEKIQSSEKLYGDGKSSHKIYRILKSLDLKNLSPKSFYDLQ